MNATPNTLDPDGNPVAGDVDVDRGATVDARSVRFRKAREKEWLELAGLLQRVERRGVASLGFEEAQRFSALYRQTINSLSLARSISLDTALLTYLENISTRAYLAVYAPRERLDKAILRFFFTSGPQAVRRNAWYVLLATFLLALGGAVAYALVLNDSTWFDAFVPGGLSQGRGPGASEETLRRIIYPEGRWFGFESLSAFSVRLFTHNTGVAIFSFTLGIMAAVPTAFLAFYNGTILGAFFAVHGEKGLALDLLGWLSIHGVTEIAALLFAAAGGFKLGAAILFPGDNTRARALRLAGPDAVKLAVLSAVMLLLAAVLEGFGRQLITDLTARLVIGWGIGALWLFWILRAGRETKGAWTFDLPDEAPFD
ncbi:MAG: stage II sporulation protein M, partial [Pseudomonadota bacterium]